MNKTTQSALQPAFPVKAELTDDWGIYVSDQNENWFSCQTEFWGEWGYFDEEAWTEPNAVDNYMIPVMYKKQRSIKWKPLSAEDVEGLKNFREYRRKTMSLEKEVVRELNLARQFPKKYALLLAQRRQYQQYYDGNLFRMPGETVIQTDEGASALEEAIHFLRSVMPMHPLRLSNGMSLGAMDHVAGQGETGATGYESSDGSRTSDRVSRYGTWQKILGENISYGPHEARDIVVDLIVDDRVPDRSHRKNIFNPAFCVVGVACGDHAVYRSICVMTLAREYEEH